MKGEKGKKTSKAPHSCQTQDEETYEFLGLNVIGINVLSVKMV